MEVTFITIIIGAHVTITKGLIQGPEDLEIRGRVETIQTTASSRSAIIYRRVLKTCCHSNSSEWPPSNADKNNPQRVIIIVIKKYSTLTYAHTYIRVCVSVCVWGRASLLSWFDLCFSFSSWLQGRNLLVWIKKERRKN